MEVCRYWESCTAPICPLDVNLSQRSWFAGEEICRRKPFQQHLAVLAQKRIERRFRRGKECVGLGGVRKRAEQRYSGEELLTIGQAVLATREKKRVMAGRGYPKNGVSRKFFVQYAGGL